MPKAGVGLMARFPQLGQVKTRLAARIGENRALVIYRQMLKLAVARLASLDSRRVFRTAFVAPAEGITQFSKFYPGLDAYLPQIGNDLGARMLQALSTLRTEGSTQFSLLIGADIPGITDVLIHEAIERIAECDCVLGPTADGGYYLIGFNGPPAPEFFSGIRWGSNEVLARTRKIANGLNFMIHELDELQDVDTLKDLETMRAAGILPEAAEDTAGE